MINRDTLSEQVANWLIQEYFTVGVKPGDALPSVAEVSGRLGVSRPVVREAFKELQGRGFIQIDNGRNATIRPLDDSILREYFRRAAVLESGVFRELIELRRGLEIQSAALTAARRSEAEADAMADTVARMRAALSDPDAYAGIDLEFHLQIASATRNALLASLVASIRASLRDTILYGLRKRATAAELEAVQQRHEDILRAIQRGDARQAEEAMARHFDEALAFINGSTTPHE